MMEYRRYFHTYRTVIMESIMRTSIRSTNSALMILIAILLLNISAAIAQSETKITADDAAGGDQFGISVSISGDYAVVGGEGDDGQGSGSVYIFVRDDADWTQAAKLTADDAMAMDFFGHSVSISGDYAVVG
ncbi:MAG: FG-GAP repeat protein, partial [Calditrichaeota bacterium]|nr:FG-GAP repeat protein [Calditrichota bacterium]